MWIGDAPPIGYSVSRNGFDCVVLMAQEYQPHGCYQMVDAIHAPIDDAILIEEEARRAVTAAREVISRLGRGETVLVTCAAGLNRSGLVCGLVLTGGTARMSPDRAIALIRAVRGPDALSNVTFTDFIRRMAS